MKNMLLQKKLVEKNTDTREITVIDFKPGNDEEIKEIITKAWIEILNGLKISMICFNSKKILLKKHKYLIESYISDFMAQSKFIWKIKYNLVIWNNKVCLISYSQNTAIENELPLEKQKLVDQLIHSCSLSSSVFDQAIILDKIKHLQEGHSFTEETHEYMKKIIDSKSLLLSSIAAEILSTHNIPHIPAKIKSNITYIPSQDAYNKKSTRVDYNFEDRIDVHSYNFFELVHPAYATQSIKVVHYIQKYLKTIDKIKALDVGTGTGVPLMMILEMMHNIEVTAIEPSTIAFRYLQENIGNTDIVTLEKKDFLHYNASTPVDLIFSIGASHHFNTDFFFQHVNNQLGRDGIFIVSDEFISPFTKRKERIRNIILHHIRYISDIMFPVPSSIYLQLSSAEQELISFFNNDIPLITYFAQVDQIDNAYELSKELYQKTHSLDIPHSITHHLVAFYRLQLLELEAMVAGLDYEVEQKTYPENFVEMAKGHGLVLLDHERIYETHGKNDMWAGTHVFVFGK